MHLSKIGTIMAAVTLSAAFFAGPAPAQDSRALPGGARPNAAAAPSANAVQRGPSMQVAPRANVAPNAGVVTGTRQFNRQTWNRQNWAARNWNGRHWNRGAWRYRHYGPTVGFAFGTYPYWSGPYGYYDEDYYGAYAAAPEYGADVQYCMRRFRSYDPASGTYLGYDGERHPCP